MGNHLRLRSVFRVVVCLETWVTDHRAAVHASASLCIADADLGVGCTDGAHESVSASWIAPIDECGLFVAVGFVVAHPKEALEPVEEIAVDWHCPVQRRVGGGTQFLRSISEDIE